MRIHGDAIRFGIHAGQHNASYEQFQDLWRRAEDLGYDWISVFDHFLPIYSDPTGPCFDGPTMLASLATQTQRIRVGILVTSVTYRHPAVAANIAATIDHISGGRVEYGIGAGWYELEHDQYGIDFPRIGVRMDMLDEACTIMRSLWTEEATTFAGQHWQLTDAWCNPKPVQERLPLVIGGGGEKRTLRIVAEHADVWNTFLADDAAIAHKLDVLRGHCADVGRDPDDIRVSLTFRAIIRPTQAEADAAAAPLLERFAGDERALAMFVAGTPQTLIDRLQAARALGARDFLVSGMAPWDTQTIELIANEVAPAVRA